MPLGDEENWLALAYFAAKKNEQNQVMTARLLNTLLGLGRVRPWITWSGAQPEGPRPRFTYTSRSLLSHLALQLCLRISTVEAFVVCFHCGSTYLPPVRAPKAGKRACQSITPTGTTDGGRGDRRKPGRGSDGGNVCRNPGFCSRRGSVVDRK